MTDVIMWSAHVTMQHDSSWLLSWSRFPSS